MFTGIIEELGVVSQAGSHLKIDCRRVLEDTTEGASIAVNGVCLTAVEILDDAFRADLAPETLARTNLGELHSGSLVNLERPLAVGDRLSGHMVQGHVDGTAEFLSLTQLPDENWWLEIHVPPELERYLIFKGSITIDGVSLTIAKLEGYVVSSAIIPHTYEFTAIRGYRRGMKVNVEVDMIAKYVEKLAALPDRML